MMGGIFYIGTFSAISPTISGDISTLFAEITGEKWLENLQMDLVFLGMGIYIMALFLGMYALITMHKLKKEEQEGRNEIVLDKKVSRKKYMGEFQFVEFAGSTALFVVMGIVGAVVYSIVMGTLSGVFWQIFLMSVSKLLTVWIL
jgi:ABC-2 type transport system permease protein